MIIFVTELKTDGFRNLSPTVYNPVSNFNIITGKNAQGKTNLIEAIWLMTGCRSFRGSKERELVAFDKNYAEINLSFRNCEREQNILFRIGKNTKEKKIFLNGVQCKGGKNLFEQFQSIAFLPSDIELAEGSPEKRRIFIDMSCSQLKPAALDNIKRYAAVLANRNAVLKNIAQKTDTPASLAVWDEQLAVLGAYISLMRKNYILRLNKVCNELYSGITDGLEQLSISYRSNIYPRDYDYPVKPDGNMADIYRSKLAASCDDDIRLGFTQYGVHRDDLSIKINGLPVRIYGSQGQRKSTALVMKLAHAEILNHERQESPVILLDDVMGELDSVRRNLVSRIVGGMQVFITSCSMENITPYGEYSHYIMENGIIRKSGSSE